ncbi:helix-turn-helix domain-containing protein [Bacillaceae bacterium C204]|uniref:helix-turn-helix domain-containing protein n=1 Tax=Neobacillus sp. 204 TaxID=3383351 RepID=UPI0039787142
MIEGKIIQFYRIQKNMKQSELGEGICSTTHISKIERGLTEVSPKTLQLLADKLEIDLQTEIKTYMSLDILLKEWLYSISMKIHTKADQLKEKLEHVALLQMPTFFQFYILILTRHYLSTGNQSQALKCLKKMESCQELSQFEKNLFLHNKGFYELRFTKNFHKAISILNDIDGNQYTHEYLYHLAYAYDSINSRVLALYYASKALQYFKDASCFTRIIETETLILMQLEQSNEMISLDSEFNRLIDMTVEYGLNDHRASLYTNFGYFKLREGNYLKAIECYENAMYSWEHKNSYYYLCSLEEYITTLIKGKLKSKDEILALAKEGLKLAKKTDELLHIHIFNLHILTIQDQKDDYYQYLEYKATPYFNKINMQQVTEDYQIQLFDYYMENQEMNKANSLAKSIIDNYRKNIQFL